METLSRFNGNDQEYTTDIPKVVIITKHGLNDIALKHLIKNTGIAFKVDAWGNIEGQPETANQLALLFVTYNFKTQYHDNGTFKNTLYMKFCNNDGYAVDQICPICAKENNIHWTDAKESDRLSV